MHSFLRELEQSTDQPVQGKRSQLTNNKNITLVTQHLKSNTLRQGTRKTTSILVYGNPYTLIRKSSKGCVLTLPWGCIALTNQVKDTSYGRNKKSWKWASSGSFVICLTVISSSAVIHLAKYTRWALIQVISRTVHGFMHCQTTYGLGYPRIQRNVTDLGLQYLWFKNRLY